ncbi:MAG: hypothetical protein IJT48_03185 [Bacteroidaceae bacterium]|nr:hypothetical protein [Bacteroidaceae bacterium]
MAKRRKKKNRDGWQSFDNIDDFLDAIEKNARKQTEGDECGSDSPEPEVEKISLRDFVVEQKISAFINGYAPCKEGDTGYEQFDDARLREVFKAYVCGLGDPLKLYVEDLQTAGFQMTCSMLTGEPCIFARRKA